MQIIENIIINSDSNLKQNAKGNSLKNFYDPLTLPDENIGSVHVLIAKCTAPRLQKQFYCGVVLSFK